MVNVKSGIGVVGAIVVALANVATTWAQSDELSRQLRETISRTQVNEDSPSAAAAFSVEVKITASDGAHFDEFGWSVAISGDTAIVGAQYDDDNGVDSGSAYVYRRNEGGVDNWGQVAKVTASDGRADDLFGRSVAISGDTAIVGARGDDDNVLSLSSSGSAYVFQRDEGGVDNWGEVTKITASDGVAGDLFGDSVAIRGDTVFVGAARDDDNGTSSGSVYVYRRDQGGANSWGQVAKLTASDGASSDWFGWSIAISGDTAIVGALHGAGNESDSGSAYVYRRNEGGSDNWGEVAKLTASDGAQWDAFGNSVGISGDTVIVGAFGDDDTAGDSGSAYLYERDSGGTDNWGEVTKITASDGAQADQFGLSVAISGDTAIVGASGDDDNGAESGSAYLYQRDVGGGGQWGEVTKTVASDGGIVELFGISVAISEDTAIVGEPRSHSNDEHYVGSAYLLFSWCSADAHCSAGDACRGAETCDTETGECLPGTPVDCDDGNDCDGIDSCDPQTGECIDGEFGDCDDNGIDDACELADCGGDPACDDCDGNGSLDRCDIAGGQPDVNGNGVLDECEPCTDNASCDDSELCSFDRCIDNLCWNDRDAKYGDVAGAEGVCGPDGDVNLFDILAVLDGFAGRFVEGCELVNIDIAGDAGSCVPNGTIDLFDILADLNAFQGLEECCVEGA